MKQCAYIYCRRILTEDDTVCSFCNYPVGDVEVDFYQELQKLNLPQKMIDMHQILRSEPDALEKQLKILDRLRIEKALLQAGLMEPGPLFGNTQLMAIHQQMNDKKRLNHQRPCKLIVGEVIKAQGTADKLTDYFKEVMINLSKQIKE